MSADTRYVLVVEDEPSLGRLVADYLAAAGFETRWIDDGLAVLPAVRERLPDLIVLDLMLPGRDGLSICRELRTFCEVPVLMLTARVEELDRLVGLEAGADDYVCKPFSPREVVARVKAILRRPWNRPAAVDAAPGLQIDAGRYEARLHGELLDLTPLEFRLLQALAEQPGRVFSRDQLLDRLHDDQRALSDRAIDSHVKNLRRKLERVRPGDDPIRSVYGVGYRFEW
ncbi:response regulator [Rubrivivax gelatinosus]|uniref:Two-component system response regulator BaeR n=1 Tax=Rubrivivax gelatinosus TaxID=28068 RepID=A0A4R2M5G5_RUBGE|nr:response regulator [Rubrivivax gelatinosus]MBK1689609.1 two-component system response regulator BaeR [Rubrivivax gelatinosus]TCP01281.1 two-component system response regulator BaeR [Rubrivivax gelatinosus]